MNKLRRREKIIVFEVGDKATLKLRTVKVTEYDRLNIVLSLMVSGRGQ